MPEQTAKHSPAVRIVHPGGPARLARVYINGQEATTATRVEIVLDASHDHGVHARIEFVGRPPIESANAQLDVAAEAAEMVETKRARFFWPVLLGLLLDGIPAGLAWWAWRTPGALATAVWVLCVMGGIIWTLGVLGSFVGYARVMVTAEPDDEGAEQ